MPKREEFKGGFADVAYENRRRRPNFLDKVNTVIDWRPVDKVLKKALRRKKTAPGNVPYPALNMFKILLLQSWYNLSDVEAEDSLADRASFSVFAGFSLDLPVPDSTTICRFRNSLLEAQVLPKLFKIINDQLSAGNFIIRQGALIDASEFEKLVDNAQIPQGVPVSADKGYASENNRQKLRDKGLIDHIMHKAARNRPLTESQKAENKQLSKLRGMVERVFGTWKRNYGFARTRYLGQAKVEMELTLKAISFNLKKACLLSQRA